jgi:hypothetical protein
MIALLSRNKADNPAAYDNTQHGPPAGEPKRTVMPFPLGFDLTAGFNLGSNQAYFVHA